MEIDVAKSFEKDQKKQAELEKLRKEGRCYKCLKQGHMKKACPDWEKEGKGKPPPYQPKARSTTTKEEKEGEPQDLKQLARAVHGLDERKTDELFELMMDEDF